jgi:hypothetical protein
VPESTVGGEHGPVRGQDYQRDRKSRDHLLVIPALGLDQGEQPGDFSGFPLLKIGAFHVFQSVVWANYQQGTSNASSYSTTKSTGCV